MGAIKSAVKSRPARLGYYLCRKVSIPYEQVLRWVRDDYRWTDVLEACHIRYCDKIEMAMMLGRMKFKEGLKYLGNTELPF